MQIYNAMVVPIMTYGCESWVLREKEKSRLQAMEMTQHFEEGCRSD